MFPAVTYSAYIDFLHPISTTDSKRIFRTKSSVLRQSLFLLPGHSCFKLMKPLDPGRTGKKEGHSSFSYGGSSSISSNILELLAEQKPHEGSGAHAALAPRGLPMGHHLIYPLRKNSKLEVFSISFHSIPQQRVHSFIPVLQTPDCFLIASAKPTY